MVILKLIFVMLVGLVTTINGQSTSLSRATFGESCDKGVRCDSRSSLSCIENTCQCVKPTEMSFNKQKGKCVVLSGERCSYTAVEIQTDQIQEKRWTERLDCVDNAVCNNEGYCDCQNTFYEGSDGSCIPKRLQGQNCTIDNECRTDMHLMCVSGVCSCNQTEAVFDASQKQCVARSGVSCVKYEGCVRNAYCPRRHGYYSGSYDLCTCSHEYKVSKSGLCLAKYGMYCNVESAPCSEEFSCIGATCSCHFPDHQKYNETSKQCDSFVRGPCSEDIEGNPLTFPCVPNADCKKQDGIPECTCNDGYIESKNRLCNIAYGQICGQTTESCDEVANLKCRNGLCLCPDFQIYDKESSKCRGLVGSKCTSNDQCITGAMCQPYRDEKQQAGVCRCVSPSVTDSRRMCTAITMVEFKSFIAAYGTAESMEEEPVLADTSI